MKILIVGAGFSGAVVAEQLSKNLDCRITVIDQRDHIGGNCHSEREKTTGIMVYKYGPHIFNTGNEAVWNYIQQFGKMISYTHRVKAIYKNKVYSLPINLHTINQFFSKNMSPNEAETFISDIGLNIENPQNFEEQALKMIGEDLYKAFMFGYTKKQWGCDPKELPASILKRLPVRFNYNDCYYDSKFCGIPENGYTDIIQRMLQSDRITVRLNEKFDSLYDVSEYDHVFYTGPIDAYFDYQFGRLSYRTVYFERFETDGDYQGTSQVNYSDEDIPFTRICEHKHFTPWENHDKTVYFKEYSKETQPEDIPYYPKRLSVDMEMLSVYDNKKNELRNITFLGRLATYRYMDMHHVIDEALKIAKQFIIQTKFVAI